MSLTTTPTSGRPNRLSRLTALYLGASHAHSGWSPAYQYYSPQSTWYHTDVDFPPGGYVATTGRWNVVVEWHDDAHTGHHFMHPDSIALEVWTDYPVTCAHPGRHPRFVLRLAGGRSTSPLYETVPGPANIEFGRRYSMTFHFVWSTNHRVGRVEWYIDGKRITYRRFPTLYSNPDGTRSSNTFGVYNYNLSCGWASTVDFARIAVGPTRPPVEQ